MAKELTGSIKQNARKEQPKHPDLKGSATIGGVDYWISGWHKEGNDGPWTSLAFTAKDAAKSAPKRQDSGGVESLDNDIPF